MRTTRLVILLALALAALIASGCTTIYYQSPKVANMFMVATGKDATDFGGDKEAGKGKFIQPWVLAWCLAHESTNLPFYYERILSWGGSPPSQFVVQTPILMMEFSDRRDQAERLTRMGVTEKLLGAPDPKNKNLLPARALAMAVGLDTWIGAGFALFRDGYARYSWGHKPELGSDKMNVAGFGFHVSINPDAETVTVRTSKRDLAGGFALVPKVATFDVSKVKYEHVGKDGKKQKIGAFDWTDGEGKNLATQQMFDEIDDWKKSEAPEKLRLLLERTVAIPPEVVAKTIKFAGTPESIQE